MSLTILLLASFVIAEAEIDWFKMYEEKSLEVTRLQYQVDYMQENWKPRSDCCSCSGGSNNDYSPQIQTEVTYSKCDLNKDGNVDIDDLSLWADCEFGSATTAPCDITGNGIYDINDLSIWADCYN